MDYIYGLKLISKGVPFIWVFTEAQQKNFYSVKILQIIYEQILFQQDCFVLYIHLILLPSCHSPSFSSPLALMYIPLPCCFPFSQFPLYLLPSGHSNSP